MNENLKEMCVLGHWTRRPFIGKIFGEFSPNALSLGEHTFHWLRIAYGKHRTPMIYFRWASYVVVKRASSVVSLSKT